jgi:hypothetical protein
VAVGAGERPIRGCVMARSRSIYTLREVAGMIGENFELMQELTAKSDNIAEGELVYVRDGSEDGTKGLTKNGIDDLQNLLADIRTWDGGIRQFLVYEQCDPEMIERVTAGENAFGGRSPLRSHTRFVTTLCDIFLEARETWSQACPLPVELRHGPV